MTDDTSPALIPAAWFHGASRVVFVHAHPDDETIATGGTLAALTASGLAPGLITCTRGEQGEVMPGPLAHLAGSDRLAEQREQELATALTMLGVQDHAYLGTPPAREPGKAARVYEDSGMEWGEDGRARAAAHTGADALTNAPANEVVRDLLIGVLTLECDAIVSYDDGGGYGHPDHVRAHQAARAVAHAIDVPFWEIVSGDDADDTVEAYDVGPWLERKRAALTAHSTQLTVEGDDIVHVGGQRQAIDRVERYRLVPGPKLKDAPTAL